MKQSQLVSSNERHVLETKKELTKYDSDQLDQNLFDPFVELPDAFCIVTLSRFAINQDH